MARVHTPTTGSCSQPWLRLCAGIWDFPLPRRIQTTGSCKLANSIEATAGTWMVPQMSLNYITPGCLAGTICYGHGLMVTADLIIVSRYWNEGDHSLMVSCTSLAPTVPIPHGVAQSYIGLQPSPRSPLDTSLISRLLIPASFAVSPVDAFAIFTIAAFLTLASILCDKVIMAISLRRAKRISHQVRPIGVVMGCSL